MEFARSGKGVGLVVPSLLTWPGSAIVHDIKGENWKLTAGWRFGNLIDGTQDDVVEAYRIIRGELEAYGECLADKAEILALNKIDALTPELREEKVAELEAVAGRRPMLVSGVSGEGVPELLRAAWAEVRKTRGEVTDPDAEVAQTTGWTP